MPLSSINLNLITSLKALLDEANVTRAARRLNVTQSAMSKNLAQLREIFNDQLLVRVGNKLILTERAHELSLGVDSILSDVNHLIEGDRFNPATCENIFKISTTDYVAERVIPDALAKICIDAPHIRVELLTLTYGDSAKLRDRSLDFISCIRDKVVEGLEYSTIGYDHFVCCMRKNHPLINTLGLDEYCKAPHAVVTGVGDKIRPVDDFLLQSGRSRLISYSAPLYGSVFEVVKRSDLLLTIPAHIAYNLSAQYNLSVVDLPFELSEFEYSLFWHQCREHDQSHAWFRDRLMEEICLLPASNIPDINLV